MDNFKDEEIEIVEMEGDEDIEIVDEDEDSMVNFKTSPILSSSNHIVVDSSDENVVYEDKWNSPEDFKQSIIAKVRAVPLTYADSKNSLRRAASYLESVEADLIAGVESDTISANLSEDQLRVLDEIESGIEVAMSHISACMAGKLTKIATKSSKFVYYVNPFIFGMARIMINGKVSQGKSLASLYSQLQDQYKLNDREKLELHFILEDMGYPMRGSFVDGIDMAAQYNS